MLTAEQLAQFDRVLNQPDCERLPSSDEQLLLQKGILLTLYQDVSPQSITLLIHSAHHASLLAIRVACVNLLVELAQKQHTAALEGLFDLAVIHNQPQALNQIRSGTFSSTRNTIQTIYHLLAGQTPEYRHLDPFNAILTDFFFMHDENELQERLISAAAKANLKEWLILINALTTHRSESMLDLVAAFAHFSTEHQKLTLFWLHKFTSQDSTACEDAICQIFIHADSKLALEVALEHGYFPSSPIQAALFHFLAGNWDAYTNIDFNHALIAQAYETATHAVRKRILEVSRLSGKQEWMGGLSTAARIVWLDDLNDPDWEVTLTTLKHAQRFDELWRLAQLAPPLWSARLLTELAETQWHPPTTIESAAWEHLLQSAAQCKDRKPKIQPASVWRSPSADITSLAYSPQANLIAVGGSDAFIYLWDTSHNNAMAARLSIPVPQLRAAAFSPQGDYLVAACGDHALRIYRMEDAKLVKSLEGHTGLVRSLAFLPYGRSLVSAGFDGSLRTWRFPQGQLLNTLDLGKTEVFSLAISPDGLLMLHAGSDLVVTVRRVPSGEIQHRLLGHEATITNLSPTPSGAIAASASRDGQLMLWNYLAGRRLAKFTSGKEPATQLLAHPNHPVLILGGLQGNLTLCSMNTGTVLAQIKGHTSAITGLAADPGGARIYTSSLDGMLCQWDLRIFLLIHQPQSQSPSKQSALIELQKACLPGSAEWLWLGYIQELNHWRQQFDIQIDDTPHLMSIGEFDIQL